mgnify:FL=1
MRIVWEDEMTTKQKLGCVLSFLGLLVNYPLTLAYGYMLLKYIQAPNELWILWIVSQFFGFVLSVGIGVSGSALSHDK